MKEINANKPASYWFLALLGLLTIGLAQPLFLFLIWHFQIGGNAPILANDLGALMGAIFTAGGLVVAITSIYTMASVDKVTQRAIEPVLANVAVEIDRRIRQYLEAYGYYTRAQAVNGWSLDVMEEVEALICKALSLEPGITGLYSWTASRLFQMAAIKLFQWIYPQHYNDGIQKTPKAEIAPFVARAIHWTEAAIQHNDGDRTQMYRQLALLHGMLGDSPRSVIKYVRLADSTGGEWTSPLSVALLLRGCRNEEDAAEVIRAVRVSPMDQLAISARIREKAADDLRKGYASEQYIDFVVFPRAIENDPPESAGTVRVLYQENGELGLATWIPLRQTPGTVLRHQGIPEFTTDATGQATSALPIALDSVLAQLTEKFLVIREWGSKNWFQEEL